MKESADIRRQLAAADVPVRKGAELLPDDAKQADLGQEILAGNHGA